jgi:hypothetical protein
LQVLHAERVLARRYFWPGCHRMEPYRSHFPHASLVLPYTEKVARQVLVLPTGTAMGPDEILGVCDIIRTALAQAGAVKMALSVEETSITPPSQVAPVKPSPGAPRSHDGLGLPLQDSTALGVAAKKLG